MERSGVSPIGKNIIRYRKAEGLSAAELSERAGEGLTRSVIANLESGRKDDVTVKQLIALANALRVPPTVLVVDLFTPGDPSPYPMPEMSAPAFSRDKLKVTETTSQSRVAEFHSWFSGEQLFMTEPLTGAPEMVSGAMNALRGYRRAWYQLSRAVARVIDLGDVGLDDDPEILREESGRRMAAIEAAVNVIRWSKELSAKGIAHTDIGKEVDDFMARARIPFNFDTDNLEFPDLSAVRWL